MIVEERIYTLHPGKTPEFLRLYETEGMPMQRPVLGTMIGFFTTEFGTLNQIVHMWGYPDLETRLVRRAKLMENPAWAPFTQKLFPLILKMENKLLIPTSFSPIK